MVKFTEDASASILAAALAYRLALDAYEPETMAPIAVVQAAWERKEAVERELKVAINEAEVMP